MAMTRASRSRQTSSGSVAYDLQPTHTIEMLERTAVTPKRKQRVQTEVQTKPFQLTSALLLTMAEIVVVGVMLVMLLMSYASIHAVSIQTATLNQELTSLKSEYNVLLAEYEQTFDMETVKAAAIDAGMSKPSKSQIFYMDFSGGNQVELHQNAALPLLNTLMEKAGNGASLVVEYFR